MKPLGQMLRAAAAILHNACGAIAYRFGCRASARHHYERVLLLRGRDFRAYVQLGRLAFDSGDYASWRRELENARRLDPERFARLRHPLELFEPRLAGTSFEPPTGDGRSDPGLDDSGARAVWRSLRPPLSGPRLPGEAADGLDSLLPGAEPRSEVGPPRFVGHLPAERHPPGERGDQAMPAARDPSASNDDCASAAERRRFRELGPIAADELRRCDLDELLRRLSG
jgi:hypothetical protein